MADETTPPHVCETCAHWTPVEKAASRFGSCASPKFVWGYNTPFAAIPDDGVSVEDDEGWGFHTGRVFGCIHWTVRSSDHA